MGQVSVDQGLPPLLSGKKIVPGSLLCFRVFEQAEWESRGEQGCLCRAASLRMHPAQNQWAQSSLGNHRKLPLNISIHTALGGLIRYYGMDQISWFHSYTKMESDKCSLNKCIKSIRSMRRLHWIISILRLFLRQNLNISISTCTCND